jgi:uncharacterized protein YbjT (DUF2867 family)
MAADDSGTLHANVGIRDVEHLEDLLSTPTPEVVEALSRLDGDLLILGASGKMGPTLARMARRALDAAGSRRRVIGVARFADGAEEAKLRAQGVEPIRCDLLDPAALDRLPDTANVLYLVGRKFGSSGQESLTWAVNCALPDRVGRRFRESRIVALSTGNVYGLTPVDGGGSRESDQLNPSGEYAMSCLGRERVFEHASRTLGIAIALVRLNYASEMRYGVLVDLARRVAAGETIDVAMGYFNTIWQADANAQILRTFDHVASPPFVINVTGPEVLGVRGVAQRLGDLLGRPVTFVGAEAPEALLSDSSLSQRLLGPRSVGAEELLVWTADWVVRGGATLDRPTHFEVRDGRY